MVYNLIKIISILVRQFLLPNPFEPLGETFSIMLGGAPIVLSPLVLNWLAEPALHFITFLVVGIYYRKSMDTPALGSILYLVFYATHVGIIYIISLCHFALWSIIVFVGIYISLHIAFNKLTEMY